MGRLWEERGGIGDYCPGRWALWKERFGVVANDERASEVTRRIARDAQEEMQEIEDTDEMRMYDIAQF